MKTITSSFLSKAKKAHQGSAVVRNALIKNGITAVSFNHEQLYRQNFMFSHEIYTGKTTDQKQSGRCWMFAGLNLLREKVMREKKIEDIEFSQSYLQIYDKIEKANAFLEKMIELKDKKVTDREMEHYLSGPMYDGGWWGMFAHLIKKYGVMPKDVMPETHHSGSTHETTNYLNTLLRQYALALRTTKTTKQAIELKDKQMIKLYEIITQIFGIPPEKFKFMYKNKKKKLSVEKEYTATSFLKTFVKFDPDEYVSLSEMPQDERKLYRTYQPGHLMIVSKEPIKSLNVPFADMKKAVLKQIKAKEPVWYACGVRQMMERDLGFLDEKNFLYEEVFHQPLTMSKKEYIEYYQPMATHAMTITGVHLEQNKPTRWKVENSWGDKVGKDGYFVMSDTWFENYTLNVIINKKYLPKKIVDAWEKKPIKLEYWEHWS